MDALTEVQLQTDECERIPDSLTEYEGYQQDRARLLDLLCQVRASAADMHIAGFLEDLTRLQERVSADQFKVLVIGNFKTGKSTFINALLGADILYTAAPPATAFITEIKYGRPPRALLHYKKEYMNGHNGPRQLSIEDLSEEIRITDYNDDDDRPKRKCPYDRAEVFYAVDLCRHGVILIDSPGLNEAESRAKITLEYLPDVDAAVFLTSSHAPLGMQEVDALQHVEALHPAVFLVCNHFDAIRGKDRPEVVKYVFDVLSRKTTIPRTRTFFTSALRALEGRIESDAAQVSASHFPEFEQALERFLTHERGKAKLLGTAQQLKNHLHMAQVFIPARLALLSRGLEELEIRYLSKQEPLQRLEIASQLILVRFDVIAKELSARVGEEMRSFVTRTINKLPGWARDQQVDLDTTDFFRNRKLKKAAEPILNALRELIADEVRAWTQGHMKELVAAFLKEREEDLAKDIRAFYAAAQKILDQDLKEAPELTAFTGAPSMEAFTLQTIATVAAPGVLGALTGIGFLFAAHPFLGVLGLVATAIYTAVKLDDKRIEFKEHVAKGVATDIERQRDKLVRDSVATADSTFSRVRADIDEKLRRQIEIIRGELDAVIAEKRVGEESVEITRQRLKVIEAEFVVIDRKLAEFVQEVGTK